MSKDNKNMMYTARDIEQYLTGKLSPLQMHAMEKAALDDPFLAEAMEGYEGMKGKEWNNQLSVLHAQLAEKGAVAKVIPLHDKPKNNWWKAAAAILILGAGTVLTFVLTKDKPEENNSPQIAQTINTNKDSLLTGADETPASATESQNLTTSPAKEELKTTGGSFASTETVKQVDDKRIPLPATTQTKPLPQTGVASVSEDKVIAVAPSPANNNVPAANNNAALSEEIIAAKDKAAAKSSADAEASVRQRSLGFSTQKKEAAANNFFTAQVVSADNTPLPFTNISIKKENFGTYADIKGMVRLVSPDSLLTIEVKSVGYLPKTFSLRSGQPQTRIVLQEDVQAMRDQTVVIKGANTNARSRRATLVTDSAVNVEPADGWDNYNTYVANNLDIPEEMLKRDFPGEVELTFDVRSNGTISNIRVNKSAGAEYDEAAKRLLLEGPQWKVKKGKKTRASVKVQF